MTAGDAFGEGNLGMSDHDELGRKDTGFELVPAPEAPTEVPGDFWNTLSGRIASVFFPGAFSADSAWLGYDAGATGGDRAGSEVLPEAPGASAGGDAAEKGEEGPFTTITFGGVPFFFDDPDIMAGFVPMSGTVKPPEPEKRVYPAGDFPASAMRRWP